MKKAEYYVRNHFSDNDITKAVDVSRRAVSDSQMRRKTYSSVPYKTAHAVHFVIKGSSHQIWMLFNSLMLTAHCGIFL